MTETDRTFLAACLYGAAIGIAFGVLWGMQI